MRPSYRHGLAVLGQAGLLEALADRLPRWPRRTPGVIAWKPSFGGRPAQVRLEDLADVHTAGHAQRVEQDLDRRAVGQERHVLLGQDLGDDALVAVAAGHLVADRDHPLGGDVDLHHLQHAAGQLVAALQDVELAVLLVDRGPRSAAVYWRDDLCGPSALRPGCGCRARRA